MVKLTADLIYQSPQHMNPCKDYELILRGYKIPVIENLGATTDQFDAVDLSDNDIRKLDGFPLLTRLKTLLLSNNRICRVAENLQDVLPRLENLVLTNNQMQELGDLDPLATVDTLLTLSLMRNPVAMKRHYRLYVIHKLPQLRVLDFRRIKQKEREMADKMFKTKKGQELTKDVVKKSTTFPGEGPPKGVVNSGRGPTPDQAAIKRAIASARSLEEVERLQTMLRTGQVPQANGRGPHRGLEEMDE